MTDPLKDERELDGSMSPTKEPMSVFFKKWLITKIHGDSPSHATVTCTDETKQDSVDVKLPKIVISKGSPAIRRPSPLTQSWLQGDVFAGNKTPRLKRPLTDSLLASPASAKAVLSGPVYTFSGSSPQMAIHSASMPSTPMVSKGSLKINKNRPSSFEPGKMHSPVCKPTQNYPLRTHTNTSSPSPSSYSKIDIDSPSNGSVASSAQRTDDGTDFMSFVFPTHSVRKTASSVTSSPNPRYHRHLLDDGIDKKLPLRRTSSCQIGTDIEKNLMKKLVKAKSNIDVQKRNSSKKKKSRRDRTKSSISLTRTWSVNFEPFRIIRHSSSRSISRKMSLNENSFSRVSGRRRSSLLRMCVQNSASLDFDVDIGESVDDLDVVSPSPQVTRRSNYSSYDPLNAFKSTFESDSISVPSVYGQIKLMFQFLNEKEELQVTLLKGANIGSSQAGRLGLYATVCLMPGKRLKKSTEGRHSTRDPVFYDLFCFKQTLSEVIEKRLRIKLFNRPGIFCKSVPVGECFIKMYDYDMTASNVIWQNLRRCQGQRDEYDEFDFGSFEKDAGRNTKPSLLCGLISRQRNAS